MFGRGVLMVFVFDFALGDVEAHFEHVFEAVGLLVRVARGGLPFVLEELLGGEVFQDEVGVQDQHDPHEHHGGN